MAYTNTPEESTYRTVRVDFAGVGTGRNGTTTSKDARFVNCFAETVRDPTNKDKKYWLRQRPGLTHKMNVGVSGTGRGIAYFNGYLYSAIGNKLYRDTTEVATLGNSSGRVGFTQFNGTYTALIALDGVKGWVIKTDNTVTEITDVDFPTPHVPFPIFIDGYLFVADDGTDDIYNCNLEDPLTWTAGNFITAELYPDQIKALAKNANYLVAIGEKTTEQFYDAALTGGSPLQRNDSAVQQVGTPAPSTVVQGDGEVIFVGTTDNGGRTVWLLKGFEAKELATPQIRQSLTSEGSGISSAAATIIRTMGHKFYILTTSTRTFVFDLDEGLWHEWTYNGATSPFIFLYACDHPDGEARALHPSNGNICAFSDTVATDAITSSSSTTMTMQVVTDKLDFGSNNRKYMHRLSLVGDAPHSSAVSVAVSWSDDDYQNWATSRDISLTGDLSYMTQLGMFRRRAMKFTYTAAYPIRLEAFEMDINIGQN